VAEIGPAGVGWREYFHARELYEYRGGRPTYGYRPVHAILKRRALATGLKPPNHKRVYRVMKVHGLLLDRHAGGVEFPRYHKWGQRSLTTCDHRSTA
jgi:hypothetical protein